MFKRLAQFNTFPEAGRVGSLLVENGFHPPKVDESAHVTIAGADHLFYVEVLEEELPSAREFLIDAGLKGKLAPG